MVRAPVISGDIPGGWSMIALLLLAACLYPSDTAEPPDDFDKDGVTEADGDCDDAEPRAYPGAIELCDGLDNDCDGG